MNTSFDIPEKIIGNDELERDACPRTEAKQGIG
jgi:hypothetical protein